ncbi:hypothetical protein OLMES_3229 [Oleiphilus messinensis]|uniref:DUF4214 domain-containing protein n=1 Tax=Oleiphilus messinensis TaxID=141451 RepID=A0A1Y0IAJ2_9GAMM|nr:DUF4214 domain-containing protein [Oleiphilus messinensis]ARU57270.1 hypothetical protein OLMES_3229 [Oleiphilus messinensis]
MKNNMEVSFPFGKTAKQILICTVLSSSYAAAECVQTSTGFNAYEHQVINAYIAYYGRPADLAGFQYWVQELDLASGNLNRIMNPFGNSTEYMTRYSGMTKPELVDNLYQQLFNRAADPAGLAWYVAEWEAGTMNLQSIALNILNGADDTDLAVINNRNRVARHVITQLRHNNINLDSDLFNTILSTVDNTDSATNVACTFVDNAVIAAGGTVYNPGEDISSITLPPGGAWDSYPDVLTQFDELDQYLSAFSFSNASLTGTWLLYKSGYEQHEHHHSLYQFGMSAEMLRIEETVLNNAREIVIKSCSDWLSGDKFTIENNQFVVNLITDFGSELTPIDEYDQFGPEITVTIIDNNTLKFGDASYFEGQGTGGRYINYRVKAKKISDSTDPIAAIWLNSESLPVNECYDYTSELASIEINGVSPTRRMERLTVSTYDVGEDGRSLRYSLTKVDTANTVEVEAFRVMDSGTFPSHTGTLQLDNQKSYLMDNVITFSTQVTRKGSILTSAEVTFPSTYLNQSTNMERGAFALTMPDH